MNASRALISERLRPLFCAALAVALLLPAAPAAASTPSAPSLVVPGAMISTADGTRLWSRRADTRRPVASTIKMLNALVARDHTNLDDVVVVPRKAAAINDGDVELRTGQRVTVRQLLNMMLVASANDAAEAMAIHVAGSESKYVAMMNAKAKQLGLKNTYAADPHGLSKRERSTPSDLTVLAKRVLADPVLSSIVKQRSVRVPRPGGKYVTYSSTNHLLGHYTGIQGVKTGFTRPAGFCLVAAAKRGDVQLVGVVLGASTLSGRFSQMRKLLDWGFAHTHMKTLASQTQTFTVCAPVLSGDSTITARPARTIRKVLLDGTSTSSRIETPSALPSVITTGQQVAVLQLRVKSSVVATIPLLATASRFDPVEP